MAIKAQTIEGVFWLPESPERRVEGTLTIEPEEGAELELAEVMVEHPVPQDGAIDVLRDGQFYPVILGETHRRKPLCLTDCSASSTVLPFLNSGGSAESAIVNRLLIGTHETDPKVVSMTLHTPKLVEFVDGRTQPFAVEGFGTQPLKIEWSDPGLGEWTEIDGIIVSLESNYDAAIGSRRVRVQSEAIIKSTSAEGAPVSAHQHRCETLQKLVEFLSQSPAKHTGLTATTADETRIEVFAPQLDARESTRQPWIRLHHFADRFDDVVRLWFELASRDEMLFGAFRDLVLGGGATPDKTLWAIRFVERYQKLKYKTELPQDVIEEREATRNEILDAIPEKYREWIDGVLENAQTPSYRDQLKATIDRFDGLFDPILEVTDAAHRDEAIDEFTKATQNTRSLLTHLTSSGKSTLTDGADMHFLYERLWLIGRANILQHLEFPKDEIEFFIRSDPRFSWVRKQPLRRASD